MNIHYLNHMIQEDNGSFYIDGTETYFKTLAEVKSFLKNKELVKNIKLDIIKETYRDNKNKFIEFIKEEHNIRVTNSIIDQYINLAEAKVFSIDPVVLKIRTFNTFDTMVENKIDYILDDQSNIAISYETQNKLNTILENNQEALEFMRTSSTNFLKILKVIEKE